MNINVIGNDKRMDYVAEILYSMGCEVIRGFNETTDSSFIILPPPVNKESYEQISPYLGNIKRIYGGSISKDFHDCVSENGIQVYDYLKWDNVIAYNAELTAKGIIREAIQCNAVINGGCCLVTGYGYCGKAIAEGLKNEGCNVFVAVRDKSLRDEIVAHGYEYSDIKNIKNTKNMNCIFNTVPALVINKTLIDSISNNIMIFDIASKPGGVDFEYCRSKSIFVRHSLGIPGKEFPKEAGELIGRACYNHFNP